MNLRPAILVSAAVLAFEVVLAAVGLLLVEPGAQVPIHWGADGQPNGYASPLVAFGLTPLITVGVVALFWVIPRIEPRAQNLARSSGAYLTLWIGLVVFCGLLQLVIVLAGLGIGLEMNAVVGVAVGGLFVVIGNVLSTVRSNFLVGVRTPWTLTSERSWQKTHRVVGWAFVVIGLVTMLVAVVAPELMVWVILGGAVVIVGLSIGYSYVVWRDDPDRREPGRPTDQPG